MSSVAPADTSDKLRDRKARNQQDRRKRLAAKGIREVRGIYAPEDLHERIKRSARKICAARR